MGHVTEVPIAATPSRCPETSSPDRSDIRRAGLQAIRQLVRLRL